MTRLVPGEALHYFAEGNTARGSVSLMDSSLQDLERVYILKGGPGTGKSGLIRSVGEHFHGKGFRVWWLHCARDHHSLDGVILPDLKAGIVDGTPPHVVEPKLPGAVEQYVNLGEAWNVAELRSRKQELETLRDRIRESLDRAYRGFAEALRIHDDWEAIYIENMDFRAADQLKDHYVRLLLGDLRKERNSRVDRRFLGAATPAGAVDFVPNLTMGLKRYLLKGRPGSGKSTLLKQLADAAMQRGLDVEMYYCGFDPNSVDMVIVRDIGVAVFDSTAPHEYFPERPDDEIIDTYAHCIRPGTDERYADELAALRSRYAARMKTSIACLAEAASYHRELEKRYVQATDFRLVDRMKERILQEIAGLAD